MTTQPLRIAFLGADLDTLPLVEAAIDRHTLVGVCELDMTVEPQLPAQLRALFGRARQLDSWEALLDVNAIDAVIVSRGSDEDRRAEQLRKLIQAGMPLVVSHPVLDSMLVYYELDMIRRDTGCVVVPYLPARNHPAIRELAELVRQGASSPIGKAEQLVVTSSIAPSTKARVLAQFSRDVDLVRAVAGEMTRLGAMAGTVGEGAYASLGVQMSGPGGIAARWSVEPARDTPSCQIGLLGEHGTAIVSITPDRKTWTLTLPGRNEGRAKSFDSWSPADATLEHLESAMNGASPTPDWVDAARDIELAETIERSLHKGRTIELYYEDYTEEGTFKGTMTSLGCGLLLLGMFALGAVALAEQMGLPFLRSWPYALLGVFGLFLLLQLLMLVFRKPTDSQAAPPVSSE